MYLNRLLFHDDGALRCSGDVTNIGDSLVNGSSMARCRIVASAHHSNCEKQRPQYVCHRRLSSLISSFGSSLFFWFEMIVPSTSSTSWARGIWIMADTGKHPTSPSVVRKATPARTPPHCPAEYVTIALGLNENVDEPKWFNILSNAGEGEWLYSGVTHT